MVPEAMLAAAAGPDAFSGDRCIFRGQRNCIRPGSWLGRASYILAARAMAFELPSCMLTRNNTGTSFLILVSPSFPPRLFHAVSILDQKMLNCGIKVSVRESVSARGVSFLRVKNCSMLLNPAENSITLVVRKNTELISRDSAKCTIIAAYESEILKMHAACKNIFWGSAALTISSELKKPVLNALTRFSIMLTRKIIKA